MSKTATEIETLKGWTGHAVLYRLSKPMAYGYDDEATTTDHVVVSAAVAIMSGPETYIFPASADGEVLDWGELDGSFRGALDHAQALAGAGYEVCAGAASPTGGANG